MKLKTPVIAYGLWLVVYGFLFCALQAVATQSRINGLGVENWMIEDDYNIWLNPAQINNYPGFIWGELGRSPAPSAGTQWLGASLEIKKIPSAIGLFFARPYAGVVNTIGTDPTNSDLLPVPNFITPNVTRAPGGIGNVTVLQPENKFDCLWGCNLKGKLTLGMRFNLASNSEDDQHTYNSTTLGFNDGTVKNNRRSGEFNFELGAVLPKLWKVPKIDLSTHWGRLSVNNTYNDKWCISLEPKYAEDNRELKTTNAYNLSLLARSLMKLTDKCDLWPMFKFNLADYSNCYRETKDLNADGTLDTDTKQIRNQTRSETGIGTALNIWPFEKLLVIAALQWNLTNTINNGRTKDNITYATTEEYNWNQETNDFPLNLACEYYISKIFTLRLGMEKHLFSTQRTKIKDPDWQLSPNEILDTAEDDNTIDLQTPTTVSAGLGISPLKNLSIDAVITQDVLFSGGYILSGVYKRPIAQITVLYRF